MFAVFFAYYRYAKGNLGNISGLVWPYAMPTNQIALLRYRSLSDLADSRQLRRTFSESNLPETESGPLVADAGLSMLKLSKTRVNVGESVTVYWDIKELCGADDWIGLFYLGKFPEALSVCVIVRTAYGKLFFKLMKSAKVTKYSISVTKLSSI